MNRLLRTLLSPVERRIGAATASRLYALADQGASGVANIIAFALLGRALPVEQFGAIGMMIGLHYFIAGFHRSAVVLPFTTDHLADHDDAAAQAEDSAWWWLGLALAIALSIATALAGVLVWLAAQHWPNWYWAVQPLLLTALISPAMLGWEFARRWLYKIERADLVAFCSAIYFVILTAVAWSSRHVLPSATTASFAWVAASLVALLIALPILAPGRIDRARAARLIAKNKTDSAWLAATNLPYSVYSTASIVVLIGMIMGPIAAALFTAARTIANPAISLVSAIDSIDKPRAARALAREGMTGLRPVVARSRLSIILATGIYLGLVAIFARPLIALAFKGQYVGLEHEVRLLALGFFLFGLNLPSETMLIIARAGRTMLAIRSTTAIAMLAALLVAAPYGGTGMAIAFAITQAANLLLLRVVEAMTGRHPQRKVVRP